MRFKIFALDGSVSGGRVFTGVLESFLLIGGECEGSGLLYIWQQMEAT